MYAQCQPGGGRALINGSKRHSGSVFASVTKFHSPNEHCLLMQLATSRYLWRMYVSILSYREDSEPAWWRVCSTVANFDP